VNENNITIRMADERDATALAEHDKHIPDSDEVIKTRILTRDNGNLYRNWEASFALNRTIKAREPLPHERRMRSDNVSADTIAAGILEGMEL
jgi:hypothetical protein